MEVHRLFLEKQYIPKWHIQELMTIAEAVFQRDLG